MMTTIGRMSLMVAFALLLMATALASVAYAKTYVGTNRDDEIDGTDKADVIYGLNGTDELTGLKGGDELYGGRGVDDLDGGGHADYLNGGKGQDEVYGKWGNDRVEAADGQKDTINCGPGEDTASIDEDLDEVSNCETLIQ
jgi:Ca2+-binding RTX toxin-like protein